MSKVVNLASKMVRLIECFQSYQGEGPDTGKSMLILRFKRCNRSCPWCDTAVKMRISVESEYDLQTIQNVIDDKKCGLLITGGEPTFNLNCVGTLDLINFLDCKYYNIETNGYGLLKLIKEADPSKCVKYILSPKLFVEKDLDFYIKLTKEIIGNKNVYIKVVAEDTKLVHDYLQFVTSFNINERVYLMPEGKTRDELFNNCHHVFDMCEKYKFNFSSREHLIYGFV
jgi:organic radical activating enzyme